MTRKSTIEWRKRNRSRTRAYCRKWELNHKEYLAGKQRERRTILRKKTIDVYGGKCILCGESQYGKLSLDHQNGDGKEFRKQFNRTMTGCHFYRWLRNHNYPKNLGLRVLCVSCNTKQWNIQKKLLADHNTHVESEEAV